jgi:preprotein translocase subunit SecE
MMRSSIDGKEVLEGHMIVLIALMFFSLLFFSVCGDLVMHASISWTYTSC